MERRIRQVEAFVPDHRVQVATEAWPDSLMEHRQVAASSVEVLQAADHMDSALVVPWLLILVAALA